jgi:GA-binding protein alpha chain
VYLEEIAAAICVVFMGVFVFQLDADKNLTSQCVQGCGQVQVNVEIKSGLGGPPRINITDVLKPADSDDEDMAAVHSKIFKLLNDYWQI